MGLANMKGNSTDKWIFLLTLSRVPNKHVADIWPWNLKGLVIKISRELSFIRDLLKSRVDCKYVLSFSNRGGKPLIHRKKAL